MHTPAKLDPRTTWIVVLAWFLIIVKMLLVVWAVHRWQLPFSPGWVIVPSFAFAALATGLWLGHRDD